jgi:multidrug efflux pump
MNISAPFIKRPVATSLLSFALLIAGWIAYIFLPIAPLPEVEFPTISVNAGLPGASPETMASAVATPLERAFGKIAGVTEMTSSSSLGSTSVTLQFDLNRNIDAAARDVQAAINAAGSQLPANLPSKPNWRKSNPADSPVIILALTSDTLSRAQMYDVADSILAQKISQVPGVGQVNVSGGARPAVRVEVNPNQLAAYGINLEQVRSALAAANANAPKGATSDAQNTYAITDTDQIFDAAHYAPLIVAYRNGAGVRLDSIAKVVDSVEDIRNSGYANGRPAVLIFVMKQPGANILDVVDNIQQLIPFFQSSIPQAIKLETVSDRSGTIRASVHDVEITLGIAIILVVLVIFAFLRNAPATLIPSVAVPLSLVATLAVMYLLDYTLDNLSLMALTISTGFVVDDAIVVIENISRYIEAGEQPMAAALRGSSEIGFTVLSMSISLCAVFIPILLMGGIVGRLFREFAVVLSVTILWSLLVSLTTTPMLCARFLKPHKTEHNRLYRWSESIFDRALGSYGVALKWVLRHSALVFASLIVTILVAGYLYFHVPTGFFPQQDTSRIGGSIVGAQDSSFDAMDQKIRQFSKIVLSDPAIESIASFGGGGQRNSGRMFGQMRDPGERCNGLKMYDGKPCDPYVTVDQVINRLRRKLAVIPGAMDYLQAPQDVRVGGRFGGAQYQYTLQAPEFTELSQWAPQLLERMQHMPELRDVNSDQQNQGLESMLVIDRDTASRFGVSANAIDNTLYDAFGQRQVSTMYKALNQYHVVMEVAQEFQQNPEALKSIYVTSNTGQEVPLSIFTHYQNSNSSLSVSHQGQFPSTTISFNLAPSISLGQAVDAIERVKAEMHFPGEIYASFSGTAAAFQESKRSMPLLILAALTAVYIVLGILYESFVHPITILSTLPSAGVGALLALLITRTELSIMALIGIILLIGIVKKNAILMIDFALAAERGTHGAAAASPEDAIYQACMLRFRPIMMTTMAALFGALPLAIGGGVGSELRQPLGLTIVGGLIVSQMLTLFTTPVVYIYMDRLRRKSVQLKRWALERPSAHKPAFE